MTDNKELELMKRHLEDALQESAELLEALDANTETNWDRDFRALVAAKAANDPHTKRSIICENAAAFADEMEKIRNERRKQ